MLIFQNQIHNQLDHHQNHQSTQNHLHPCLPLTFSPDSRISIYNWKNRWKWPFLLENETISYLGYLRVLFWSGVLIEGSIWCDESGRRICFRPFGRVFRFIGFLKPSTGSVLESAEPGFGHDRTTFGSTGDDRDGPTGILHRWKSVINSSRPLKVFLWVLKMLWKFLNISSKILEPVPDSG